MRVQILVDGIEGNQQENSSFEFACFMIDFNTFEVHNKTNNKTIELSKREIELLKLFSQKQSQVVSREEILDKLWGNDQFPTSRTIDNYILAFRKIFEKDPRNPIHFHSIRGVGYKFIC